MNDLHLPPGTAMQPHIVEELSDPYSLDSPRMIVFPVDARILNTTKHKVSMIHVSREAVLAQGCFQDPRATLDLLLTLCFLASHPSLMEVQLAKKKRGRRETEVEEKLYMEVGAKSIPRVDMYIETLVTEDGTTIGYLYFFVVLDTALCFNRGMETLFLANREREPTKPDSTHLPPRYAANVFYLRNYDTYLNSMLQGADPMFCANPEDVDDNPEAGMDIVSLSCGKQLFGNSANPASLYTRFSLRATLRHVRCRMGFRRADGTIDPCCDAQLDFDSRVIDMGEGLQYLFNQVNIAGRKYGGAVRVPPYYQDPSVQMDLRLFPGGQMYDIIMAMPARIQRSFCDERASFAKQPKFRNRGDEITEMDDAGEGDTIDWAAAANRVELKGLTRTQRFRARRRPELMERVRMCLVSDANVAPALGAVFKYMRVKELEAQKRDEEWCPYQGEEDVIDARLDTLANFLAVLSMRLDDLDMTVAIHEEAVTAALLCLSASAHTTRMNCHLLLVGDGSTSKTFLQTLLRRLFIEGSWATISARTHKSLTAKQNRDHSIDMFDEAPPEMFDIHGKADAMLKEALAQKFLTHQQVAMTEHHERMHKHTRSRHGSVVIMNANKGEHQMHQALADRFFIKIVAAYFKRVGRGLTEMMNREMNKVDDVEELQQAFQQRWKFIQFLVTMVNLLIKCGLMSEPNMAVTDALFQHYSATLDASEGITHTGRVYIRLGVMARTLTVLKAVLLGFFTRAIPHWQPGRRFVMEDLFELQPFLVSDEQIAVFAMTSMSEMFVHPHRDILLKTVAQNCCEYPGPKPKYSSTDNAVDYNFLLLDVGFDTRSERPYFRAATQMAGSLGDMPYTLSIEVIESIITKYMDKTVLVKAYTLGNQLINGPRVKMPLLKKTPKGLAISRGYVQGLIENPNRDPIIEAIRSSFFAFTPNRKLLIGRTLRKPERFYPQLFETIQAAPVPNARFVMSAPGNTSRTFDMATRSLHKNAATTEELNRRALNSKRIDIRCDMEDYFFETAMRTAGYSGVEWERVKQNYMPSVLRARLADSIPEEQGHDYPQWFIDLYKADESASPVVVDGA